MRYVIPVLAILLVGVGVVLVSKYGFSDPPEVRIGKTKKERVEKTKEEWRAVLTPTQFFVTRDKGTEPAGSGQYAHDKRDGIFTCVCCSQMLFDSKTKYESGTGWPSFWQPSDEESVSLVEDNTLFKRRTEVVCSRCDAHLGHVFNDGPRPTGLRYCINSVALKLIPRGE